MHSMAGPVDPASDSENVRLVKAVYETAEETGVEAAVETMLRGAHEDFEFRPYLGGQRVLRGASEVRAFFREQLAAGVELTLRPTHFEETGDEVLVSGSVRVVRPEGGFAESQIRWTYRFRDGLLDEAHWSPRNGG